MLDKVSPKATDSVAPAPADSKRFKFTRWLTSPVVWAFLGAVLLAALYGRVAVFNLFSGVVGGDIDGFENLWDDYWTKTALQQGRNPLFTNYMYYPSGVSLRYHTLHPLTVIFAFPLWKLFGPVAATNLIFLLSLALTTFFAYLLLNDFVKRPLAAFAGATIFTYASDQVLGFFGAGQTEKLSAEWLPLYLFVMFRLVERNRRWWIYAPAGVLVLLCLSLTDWQYTMYAVMLTGLFFIYSLFTSRSWRDKGIIFLKLAGTGGVWGGLILFPLLLPMLDEAAKSIWLAISNQSIYHSRDVVDYITPDLTNPGYIPLVVMVFGLVMAWKSKDRREIALFWSIAGLLALLFTLGPNLIIAGNQTSLPMPYGLLWNLPGLSAARDPERFYSIFLIAFGLLFAFGLDALVKRQFFLKALQPRVANGILLVILGLSLFPFFLKSGEAAVNALDTPAFFDQIAQDKDQYALLELPLFTEDGRGENVYQVYQIIHNKLRFGGRYARDHKLTNPNNFSKRAYLIRDFFWLGQTTGNNYRPAQDFMPQPDLSRVSVPLLNYWNVRYIILWKEAFTTPQELEANRQLVKKALGADSKPIWENDRMEAYKVPTAPPLPEKLVLDVGNGWFQAEKNATDVYRWANPDEQPSAELYVHNLSDQPVRATLKFNLYNFVPENGKGPRTVNVDINGYPAATYKFNDTMEFKQVTLELTIPPSRQTAAGFNIINFTSPEPALPVNPDKKKDARNLSFGMKEVTLQVHN